MTTGRVTGPVTEAVFAHVSVLVQEAVELLRPAPGKRYLDGTLGGGGHSEEILVRSSPDGQVLGLDRDDEAIAAARERLRHFESRLIARQASFANARDILAELRLAGCRWSDLGLGRFFPSNRRARKGLQLPRARPARHAHGSAPNAGRARDREFLPTPPSWSASFATTARSRARAGSLGRLSSKEDGSRFKRRRKLLRLYKAPGAADDATTIRRRKFFKRCASRSTRSLSISSAF